ncbi:MAG TPA: metallophosphoesterase [Terriglobales bacterium]|nr:metallophosphoesterase [Terriglobales bacterium]
MREQIRILVARTLLLTVAKVSEIHQVAVIALFAVLAIAPQLAGANIPSSDPDFSIVLFPDTQYYNSQNAYVFQDQANWVVSHQSSLSIKLVIGLGDIVDGGGYPNVNGTCGVAPPSNWQTQWQQAQSAVGILNTHGIYYQPTIGNHDYDCQADRPQPRSATNYFRYFGQLAMSPTAYILDSTGNRTPNFYKIITIGSTNYMILSLELFPRDWVVSTANNLISNFSGPVIVVTHAYLANDGSGPTFGSTFPAGSAYPLCSGFPGGVYGCGPDSLANYNPVGGGNNDGIGLWYKLIGAHPNVFMALSGHVRSPSPGNYPSVPNYNGVGRVDCNVQSWTTLCSNPYRPIQILSDFQGQGNNGYFGYGYLRILTVSPSKKTVSVFTVSPSITNSPSNFPSGIPAWRTDSYNQYTVGFPNTFGGPDTEITHITTPRDGSHVPLTFGISAAASGPDSAGHMQIFVDGVQHADYPNVKALPSGATVALSTSGTHRVAVQTYDNTKGAWVKSVIYVTNP